MSDTHPLTDLLSGAQRPIVINKVLVDYTGDLAAAALLGQIIYWFGKDDSGQKRARIFKFGKYWIAKKREDWWDEIRLHEKTAKRKLNELVKLGVIQVEIFKFRGDPTTHIHLNEDFLAKELLKERLPLRTTCPEQLGQNVQIEEDNLSTSLTETKTETKTEITRGNVYQSGCGNVGNFGGHEKTLPPFISSLDSEKTMPCSASEKSKFPLKPDQQKVLDWLKLTGIGLDCDTMMVFVRTYHEDRLREAVAFTLSQMGTGKIKNPCGFLRNVLLGKIPMITAESQQNAQLARDFAALNNWNDVTFCKKYMRDEVTGDDLYYNLPHEVFCTQIQKLYDKSELYKGR